MKDFLAAIHRLHEDTRKLLAGVSIVVLGLGFVGLWSSFLSSRLVVLNTPAQNTEGTPGIPVAARRTSGSSAAVREPPSPVAGIAGSIAQVEKFFSRPLRDGAVPDTGGFFASVGRGLAAVADAVYMKVARFVPPYL